MKQIHVVLLVVVGIALAACSRDPQSVRRKYLEQGNKYYSNAKYKEASLLYRKALQADALFGEGYYRLALAELKLGRYSDAARALRRAVELQPENQDAATKLADIYLAAAISDTRRSKSLIPELRDLSARLTKRDPKSFLALRINGYLALFEKNLKEAIANFEAANALKPFQPDLVHVLAQTLAADNRRPESEKLLRALLEKEKTFGPAYDALYVASARGGRMDEAEQILKSKVANNPKVGVYRVQLAGHYFATQRRDQMVATIGEMTGNLKEFPTARLLAGDFFLRVREFDLARAEYGAGARDFPKEKHAYQKREVETLVAQQKAPEALNLVESILKEDQNDSEAVAMRASLWVSAGQRDKIQTAVADLQSVVGKLPDNPVLRFNYGRALIASGDVDAALVQFREAVKLRADYLPPKFALAQIHLAKQEHANAMQLANEILELAPQNVHARLIRSSSQMGMGNLAPAREELGRIIKEVPNSRDAHFQVAMIDFREKKFAAAEQIFRQLSEMTPPDPRGLPGLIEVDVALGRFDAALARVTKEIERTPEKLEFRLIRANTATRAARFDTAVADYQFLLAKNPKAGDVQYRLGEACKAKGDIACAEAAFGKARELMPSNAMAHLQMAMLLDISGRREQARPIYDQVLKIEPDNPWALNNVAYILAEEGRDLDTALTMAQKATQKMPQHPDIADTLGWIYLKKNLSDNAVRVFGDIVKSQPAHPTYRYHYALALCQRGDRPQAKRELEAALRNKPSKQEEAKIRELMARIG